jgi:hypothetical protein
MNNSTSSQNYRKSKLEEIKKINDLNLEDSTKKSLVRKALKDILSDPKVQEAQDERRNNNKEKNMMQKLTQENEYNRLLWLSDTIDESFDELDDRTNRQISILKEQESGLTINQKKLCGEWFLPSDVYEAQQYWIKNKIFDKEKKINEKFEKTNCIFDFEEPQQKYIIANVDGKKVTMCLPQVSYHKDLLEKLKYLYPNQSIEVEWWWYVHIDPFKKEIHVFWSSKDLGYAKFEAIDYYVLEKQYPWYIIKDLGNTINVWIPFNSPKHKNINTLKSIINGEKVELNIKNVLLFLSEDYFISNVYSCHDHLFNFLWENVGHINQSFFDDFSKQFNITLPGIPTGYMNEDGSISEKVLSFLYEELTEKKGNELFIGYLIEKIKQNKWLSHFSLNIPLDIRKDTRLVDESQYTLNYNGPWEFNQYVPSNTITKSDMENIDARRYNRIWHRS